ncbi:MAG: glycoside hydrolase family 3 C-terminal domain-containing protein [Fimbriimonas sp.]|nr:glycoside hydrolase family 3 C-terminal domain-containing protein [Fimbriimonas sp.]
MVLSLLLLATSHTQSGSLHPLYQDSKAPLEARVSDLFSRLTADEKMDLLTGTAFTTRPIARLGVPALSMADAGQGVRGGMDSTCGPATAFPSGVAMAASWDTDLLGRIGRTIGTEAVNKGTGIQTMLGPAVNIQRSPLGGRNGEYFSEDPYLAGRLAVGFIQGMQSTGCGACAKHYAANNEEVDRGYINVRVSERALREIYLPAFEAAVKDGHVWSIMSSYNKVNGYHSSASHYLLTDVLKKGWGFDGMVMSDWGGVHETVGAVNAGNDLEMPGPGFLRKENVERAFKTGLIRQSAIDDNARRILRTVLRVGLLDAPRSRNPKVVNSPAHQNLAFEAATKGIVLLKNQGATLPLDRKKIHSIAVIGPAGMDMEVGANGSPYVEPFTKVQPLEGLKKRALPGTVFHYVRGTGTGQPVPETALVPADGSGHGLKAEYYANQNLSGEPNLVRTDSQIQFDWSSASLPEIGNSNFSVRWTGKLVAPVSGHYRITFTADDGCRLYLDGKRIIDHWVLSAEEPITAKVDLVAGQAYDLRAEYFQASGAAVARLSWLVPGANRNAEVIEAARKSDVVIVCANTLGQEGEGNDRPSMDLPEDQDGLITAAESVNPHTIVVLNTGTPVTMTKWIAKTPAILESWFPGEQGGNAIAAILFGDVNPSGKLPTTFAAKRTDYPDTGHFPGVRGNVDYVEGIYVGYRHFDKRNIAPIFPFGHGLSYTTFAYGRSRVSNPARDGSRTVRLNITNTGHRAGAEVVQLYVRDLKPKIDRPVQELKAFQKVTLAPGETKEVSLKLVPRSFAYCDEAGKQWKADAGSYELEIGSSSRDIRSHAKVVLRSTWREPIPYSGQPKVVSTEKDLALGRPVRVSSSEVRPDVKGNYAVDGDDSTRWSSAFSDPQWISVNLGKATTIDHVVLKWETAFAKTYSIQFSIDGKTWVDAYRTELGDGGTEFVHFAPVTVRWVRMYAEKRGTEFGDSLYSFEVYAPKK